MPFEVAVQRRGRGRLRGLHVDGLRRRLLVLAGAGGGRHLDRLEEHVLARRALLRGRPARARAAGRGCASRPGRTAEVDGAEERRLEVVELELGGRADDVRRLRRGCGRRRAGSTIWSLPCFVMIGSATPSLSTRFAHDRDRAVEVVGRQLVALRRLRLQDDLEAALQVEALLDRPVGRRAGTARNATPTRARTISATRIRWERRERQAAGRLAWFGRVHRRPLRVIFGLDLDLDLAGDRRDRPPVERRRPRRARSRPAARRPSILPDDRAGRPR